MRDHGDSFLGATVDDASTEGAVVIGTERDLDSRDGRELDGFVELATVYIGEPHAPHKAFVDESGQRAHRRSPWRPRIGCMDEVEVDLSPSSAARLASQSERIDLARPSGIHAPLVRVMPPSRSARSCPRANGGDHGQ